MSGESTSVSSESPGPPLVTLNQTPQRKTQVCKFFVKNQTCHFGSKCRFLHPEASYPVYVQRSFPVDHAAVDEGTTRTAKPKVYIPPHRLRTRNQDEAVKGKEEDPLPINQNTYGQVCKFFGRNGFCKFGDNCRYLHEQLEKTDELTDHPEKRDGARRGGRGGKRGSGRTQGREKSAINENADEVRDGEETKVENSKKKRSRQICRYFRKGDCRNGSECRFWHPSAELPELSAEDEETNEMNEEMKLLKTGSASENVDDGKVGARKVQREVVQPSAEMSIETLTDEDAAKHRISDINTLMKRFPRAEPTSLPRRSEEAYKVTFVPSDPDWVSVLNRDTASEQIITVDARPVHLVWNGGEFFSRTMSEKFR